MGSYFYSFYSLQSKLRAPGHCGPQWPSLLGYKPLWSPFLHWLWARQHDLDQWDISKLSDTSRGLISPCTLEPVFLAPWKDVQYPGERRDPRRGLVRSDTWTYTPHEGKLRHPGKSPAECCHTNDPSQQKNRAEGPHGQSMELWDIIHFCRLKALTFWVTCYTAIDETCYITSLSQS